MVAGSWRDGVVTPGETLFTLAGPEGPLEVPLWLDLRGGEAPTEALTDVVVGWFRLPRGRLYLEQANPYVGVACRVVDLRTGAMTPSERCVETSFLRRSYEAIDEGLVLATSSGEGCAAIDILRWDEGTHVLWTGSLGCAGGTADWTIEGNEVLFRSNCDLGAGGCAPLDEPGPTRTWRWTEAAGIEAVASAR